MWRPKDWKVPDFYIGLLDDRQQDAYEAGADAMLEALLDKGLKVNNISLDHSGKGTIIFVPDEEDKNG